MKIRRGRELDGQRGESPGKQLEAITTGPLGMLNLLETQLGLMRNVATRSSGMGQGQAWDTTLEDIKKACRTSGHDWEPIRIRTRLEHERFDPALGATK